MTKNSHRHKDYSKVRRVASSTYQRIYRIVGRIPRGKVATYGQIATLAGMPRQARLVGYALNASPDEIRLPWHRVINSKGEISPRSQPGGEKVQRTLLEREGIVFDGNGRLSLRRFQWKRKFPTPI
ncbi:MAG: MGMT family protein [candidate division Zixibacteria bacterium]|nr:MGMT family protein [candidate division Zixibacteria bacterium]